MDGLDEITLADRTRVSEGKAGRLTSYMVEPRDFGLQRVRVKDLEGGDAEENARITRDVLCGREGPRQQLVLVNAAPVLIDRKSTRLNSSHDQISYAVFCLK